LISGVAVSSCLFALTYGAHSTSIKLTSLLLKPNFVQCFSFSE
jgi:hypothetical protein